MVPAGAFFRYAGNRINLSLSKILTSPQTCGSYKSTTYFIRHRDPIHVTNTAQHTLTTRRNMGTWPKVRPKRIRMITFDVTGTIVSFRGTLEEHYLGAADKLGVHIIDDTKFATAFNKAYKETCKVHPCFGGDDITAKEWWRLCVLKSFEYAGVTMDDHTAEMLFQRIYSTFGR